MADLKAYYESEIQILRDKLKLRDLPQDLEKSNQALTERFAFIVHYLLIEFLFFLIVLYNLYCIFAAQIKSRRTSGTSLLLFGFILVF